MFRRSHSPRRTPSPSLAAFETEPLGASWEGQLEAYMWPLVATLGGLGASSEFSGSLSGSWFVLFVGSPRAVLGQYWVILAPAGAARKPSARQPDGILSLPAWESNSTHSAFFVVVLSLPEASFKTPWGHGKGMQFFCCLLGRFSVVGKILEAVSVRLRSHPRLVEVVFPSADAATSWGPNQGATRAAPPCGPERPSRKPSFRARSDLL